MRLALAVAIVAAGCSTTPMPPPIGDSDASTPITHTGGTSCTFESQPFSIPTSLSKLEGQTSCTSWFLADFDEDGKLDLAVTSDCNDATVGVTRWLVYPNTGTGFGAPLAYPIPQEPSGCASLQLADVDADGALDLVITSLCNDATVGTSRWLVYRNLGGGFSTTATSFALPTFGITSAFPSLDVETADCTNGKPAFAFVDVTGDALPDLVVTTTCDDASVGVTHWRVYLGSSTGLGAATSFALPGGLLFASPFAGALSCTGTVPSPGYALTDFDGDGRVDLLVTQSCTNVAIGASSWNLFTNDGSAFSTSPTVVSLPSFPGQPTPAFPGVVGSSACLSGTFAYTLVDVDGDFKPDLFVTSACGDTTVGTSQWLVYPNKGKSFGAAEDFAIPAMLGVGSCATFSATHFFGDQLDLVVTQSCNDATLGASRWLVMRPQCAN